MSPELIKFYGAIAVLTGPLCAAGKDECAKYSGNPHRCCEKKYCEIAAENGRAQGVELVPVGEAIPFLGPHGCIVPPHLRPICAVHVCTISYADKSHIEHDPEKTKRYFELRRQIGELSAGEKI